ncbi:hypothetical protein KR222_003594, partial [Zaprionus bogoriensis]
EEYPVEYNAHSDDCSLYYEIRTQRCPNNYHWNRAYKRCVLPQFSGCESMPSVPWNSHKPILQIIPTAATPPSITQSPIQSALPDLSASIDPEYVCKNSENKKYLPYPSNCRKFIYCGPTVTILTCPVGLYWNQNEQSCGILDTSCL